MIIPSRQYEKEAPSGVIQKAEEFVGKIDLKDIDEVWLYYHFSHEVPDFDDLEISSNWKTHLGISVSGGFDTRKHPLLIETALINSKSNHSVDKINEPLVCSTEVFLLAESILPLVKKKLLRRLHALEA